MNKLDSYALQSALKLNSPDINECFTPVCQNKYITFDINPSKSSSFYFHWQQVIDLIHPKLKEHNISILKVGEPNSPMIDKTINHSGKSFNQTAYIINRSLLHFNSLNYLSYLSYFSDTKLVCLFSCFNSDYFGMPTKDGCVFIDSPKGEMHASLDVNEQEKTIDKIDPSHVASKILSELGINHDLNNYNMVHAGASAHMKMIEVIPDFDCTDDFFPKCVLNIRADLNFDENKIISFCSRGRRIGLITSQPFSVNFLYACKGSVDKLVYRIENSIDKDFLLNLKRFNINYQLVCYKKDIINKIRSQFIDEDIEYIHINENMLDKIAKICKNSVFKTSKIMYSKSGQYASKAHWIIGKQLEEYNRITDTNDYWEDQDFYYIYEHTTNK
jgi:hypothetical protein